MNDNFDGYLHWLGIPVEEQPPSYFRLLGVNPSEERVQVIADAAQRRTVAVAAHISGPQKELAVKLLREIAAAQICLLDPAARTAYDETLAKKSRKPLPRQQTQPFAMVAAPPVAAPGPPTEDDDDDEEPDWFFPAVTLAGAVFTGLLFLGVIVGVLLLRNRSDDAAVASRVADTEVVSHQPQPGEAVATSDGLSSAALLETDVDRRVLTPRASHQFASVKPDDSAEHDFDLPAELPSQPVSAASTPQPRTGESTGLASSENLQRSSAAVPSDTGTLPSATATQGVGSARAPSGKVIPPGPFMKAVAPDVSSRQRAIRQIATSHGNLIRAATTNQKRQSAAQSLVQDAKAELDPARQFVLFEQAQTLAVDAGDVSLAFSIVDEFENHFTTGDAEFAADAVRGLVPAAQADNQRRELADRAVKLADAATGTGEPDLAEEMLKLASSVAGPLNDRLLNAELQRRLQQLGIALPAAEPAEIINARKALANDPQDADAHSALGRYACFVQRDWQQGLTHMAVGSDQELAKISRQDVASPRTPADAVKLADAWHSWGQQAEAAEQQAAWSRSLSWYRFAQPRLVGAVKKRVDRRIKELSEVVGPTPFRPTVRLAFLDVPPGEVRSLEGHQENITALAVSMTGELLASAAEDRTVRLWNLHTGQPFWKKTTKTSHLNGLAITPDSQFVISNFDDTQFAVFGVHDGSTPYYVGKSPMSPTGLFVTPDGKGLVWGTRSLAPNLIVWDLQQQRVVGNHGDGDSPNVIDLSPDGTRIATGDARGMLHVWNTASGDKLFEVRAHADVVTDVHFSPSGQRVATAAPGEIRVWEIPATEPVATFHKESVRAVAFSPDGRRLASGGEREQVFLWDLHTGRRCETLKNEAAFSDRQITRLIFLPDPRGLVTGATGGKLRLWRLPD